MSQSQPHSTLPSRISLYAEGPVATDAKQRFIDRFVEIWSALSNEDIAAITNGLEHIGAHAIGIQLRDEHHSLSRGPSGDATAQFSRSLGSVEIIYKSLFAAQLSDAACRYWIAHELAHLFLNMTDPAHGSNYQSAEEEVTKLLVERWGFDNDDESNLNVEVFLITHQVPVR